MSGFRPATKRLFILCCVLWTLYALTFLHKPSRVFTSRLLLPQALSSIQEIRMSIPKEDGSIETGFMKKTENGFALQTGYGNYPVRQDLIERFFLLLTAKRPFVLMTKNAESYPQYGLEDTAAIRITLFGTGRTIAADLFFGETDALQLQRYLRTGSSLDVFAVENTIAPFLSLARTFWLDFQPFKTYFDTAGLQSIKADNRLHIRNGKNEADFAALEVFFKQFTCIDIAPRTETTATKSVTLFWGNGTETVLHYRELETGDYIIFSTCSPFAYQASNYSVSRLLALVSAITQ